jgi:hypothetical protein
MQINEGRVNVELDFFECWDIGNSLINDMTKQSNIDHWKNHTYSGFLDRNNKSIRMARDFCRFSNPEWIDQKLKEFKTKLEKAVLASK